MQCNLCIILDIEHQVGSNADRPVHISATVLLALKRTLKSAVAKKLAISQATNGRGNARTYRNASAQQTGADTEEILIPYPDVLRVAPALKECAGASRPRCAFTGPRVSILRKTAHGALEQRLAVHILEQRPRYVLLPGLYHTLHGHTVVPQPYRAVMICVVFMVMVPIFVIGVELRIILVERGHTPRIYEPLPSVARFLHHQSGILNHAEGIEHIRAILTVRRTVGIKMVIDHHICLVDKHTVEGRQKRVCHNIPSASIFGVACHTRHLGAAAQLPVPQRLYVYSTVATG